MQIAVQISQMWAVPPCYLGKNACLAPYCCISDTKTDLIDIFFFFFFFWWSFAKDLFIGSLDGL